MLSFVGLVMDVFISLFIHISCASSRPTECMYIPIIVMIQ